MLARLSPILQTDDPLRRLARFLAVGLLGTLLDFGLFALLHVRLGWPALAANSLSYGAGIANNYVLHRRWTYQDKSGKSVRLQATQFVAVSLSALALNTAAVLTLAAAFAPFLAPAHEGLLAKGIATAIGLIWNFLANHFWTFRIQG